MTASADSFEARLTQARATSDRHEPQLRRVVEELVSGTVRAWQRFRAAANDDSSRQAD